MAEFNWAVVILVPLIITLIVCFVMCSNMKSVHKAMEASRYIKENSFELSHKVDNYTHTTKQRIHHERANTQGGGGPGRP